MKEEVELLSMSPTVSRYLNRSPNISITSPNSSTLSSINDISCLECISGDRAFRKCSGWEPSYWNQSKCRICGHLRLLHPSQEPMLSTMMFKTLNGSDEDDFISYNTVSRTINAVSSSLSFSSSGDTELPESLTDNFNNNLPSPRRIELNKKGPVTPPEREDYEKEITYLKAELALWKQKCYDLEEKLYESTGSITTNQLQTQQENIGKIEKIEKIETKKNEGEAKKKLEDSQKQVTNHTVTKPEEKSPEKIEKKLKKIRMKEKQKRN